MAKSIAMTEAAEAQVRARVAVNDQGWSTAMIDRRDLLRELDATRAALADAERDLQLLAKVRANKHTDWLRCQLEHDRDEWRALAGTDGEDYEGEGDERGALLDNVMALLSPGDVGAEKADVK